MVSAEAIRSSPNRASKPRSAVRCRAMPIRSDASVSAT